MSYELTKAIDVFGRLEKLERALSLSEHLKQKTEHLSFSEALQYMKAGNRVSRWHRDSIYVYANKDNELRVVTINQTDCPYSPNNTELMAEDWRLIDVELA